MTRTAILLGLIGLAATIGLIAYQGVGEVFEQLAAGGFGLVIASLFHFAPMLVNAEAWRLLVPTRRSIGRKPPSLIAFTWFVWVRESVNNLLPVARIGGEVVAVRVMIQRGVRSPMAIGSIVVDMTLSVVTQFLFTLAGLGLLVFRTDDVDTLWRVALGVALSLPLVAAFVAVQRWGLFNLLNRLLRALFGDKFAALAQGSRRLDQTIRLIYRRRRALALCCVWQFLAWVVGAGEIWLALYFLGHPVSLIDALILEAAAQAVSSAAFIVPGAIGVQEGGYVLFGTMLGLDPEVALALALARRVRDVLIFVPGLILWQLSEGKRLIIRQSGTKTSI